MLELNRALSISPLDYRDDHSNPYSQSFIGKDQSFCSFVKGPSLFLGPRLGGGLEAGKLSPSPSFAQNQENSLLISAKK